MTYYGQPLLQAPVWIWTIPLYFYVGGVAGAAGALGAAGQLLDARNLRRFIRNCRWMSAGGGAIGSVLLILDLGRKSRFIYMLRVFRPTSPMSIGSWVLALFSTSATGSLALGRVKTLEQAAGAATGILGLPLAGYTAVLLSNTAVPVWQQCRGTLPYLFISSSLVSAASLLEMMPLNRREYRLVKTCAVAGGAAELLSMFAIDRDLRRNSLVGSALSSGVAGALWTGAKILSASSLIISALPGSSRRKRVISGTLGTLAALCVRFAIFRSGKVSALDPRATFRQQQ